MRCANLTERHFREESQHVALSNARPENRERGQNKQPDCKTVLPVIIAEWPRNKREVIRVEIHEYQGRLIIGCRVWWSDGDGALRPGKDGITLSLKHLPQLAKAFTKALATAGELGLPIDGAKR